MNVYMYVKFLLEDLNPDPCPPRLTRTSSYGSYHYFIILIITRL